MSLIVDKRGFARFHGALLPCSIGRGGMRLDKREGDGASPIGVWKVEYGYFRADRLAPPVSLIPLIPIGPQKGWCDDPDEAQYNEPIDLPVSCSHERLRRGDSLYDLILVLNHNRTSTVVGHGSAIFLHCWRRPRFPTEGCIAFERDKLLWIIREWRQSDRVIIR